jgi:methionyl aminopeptidase
MIKLKSNDEIKRIRESGLMLAETYREIGKLIEPGITTLALDKFARNYIEKRGGRPAFLGYQGYPSTLCTSVNEIVIHGIPDNYKLREGDVISLDCGIILNGFVSDSAVSFPVGTVSEEIARLLKVTEESLYLGIEQAVNGNRVKDISRAVAEHAGAFNYGIVHEFCGHGVGYNLHEDPQIPNYVGRGPNPRLKPGMVIAIEPMINLGTGDVRVLDDGWAVETLDRKVSAHFEHTIAIFENHNEILTGQNN